MGKPKFVVKTLTGHMSHCVAFFKKDQLRNPPKTLDSVDSFDRKLALSIAKDFVSEAACGGPFEFLKVLQVSFCSADVDR